VWCVSVRLTDIKQHSFFYCKGFVMTALRAFGSMVSSVSFSAAATVLFVLAIISSVVGLVISSMSVQPNVSGDVLLFSVWAFSVLGAAGSFLWWNATTG
jgi:hypothetical protein